MALGSRPESRARSVAEGSEQCRAQQEAEQEG